MRRWHSGDLLQRLIYEKPQRIFAQLAQHEPSSSGLAMHWLSQAEPGSRHDRSMPAISLVPRRPARDLGVGQPTLVCSCSDYSCVQLFLILASFLQLGCAQIPARTPLPLPSKSPMS